MINSSELMRRTGASHRQIDYWCRNGIIPTTGIALPGSGGRRMFEESIVDAVEFLVNFSKAFDHGFSKNMLQKMFTLYPSGKTELGASLILYWELFPEMGCNRCRDTEPDQVARCCEKHGLVMYCDKCVRILHPGENFS